MNEAENSVELVGKPKKRKKEVNTITNNKKGLAYINWEEFRIQTGGLPAKNTTMESIIAGQKRREPKPQQQGKS